MSLGAFRLGEWITLRVLCKSTSSTPTLPDSLPRVFVLDGSGNVILGNVAMPAADPNGAPGLFQRRWQLRQTQAGADMSTTSPGRYCRVRYEYSLSGSPRVVTDHFEMVPGGSSQGSHLSMFFWRRPGQNVLVQHLDSDAVVRSRNPYL